ncbi:MAG: carboxypeptidase-like regulatory domain-containing protein, partial [Bacteroidales bacterium]|nr:carboxypeptidase-like regulatory domain-containing protein [Bacteroidales bacterium]
MRRLVLLFIAIIWAVTDIAAQIAPKSHTVNGVVYSVKNNGDREVVPFATVYWLQSGTYVDCDVDGKFIFTVFEKAEDATLVATAIGYNTDTLVVNYDTKNVEFFLQGVNELEKAVVQARQDGSYLSKMTPVKTEVITAAGLCKMACCNLAESFENSASVTVGYSDAITGAKQIRLLGLSGIYTAMLDENRPAMRGLAAPFGLSYVPGQWLESIQIAKGPSSVVNGLEAITGQINMEHRKPTDEKPLFINLFVDNHLMTEANIASSLQLTEKWSTVTMGHYSSMPMGHDGNGDGFTDITRMQSETIGYRGYYKTTAHSKLTAEYHHIGEYRRGGNNIDLPPHMADIAEDVRHQINGGSLRFNYFA